MVLFPPTKRLNLLFLVTVALVLMGVGLSSVHVAYAEGNFIPAPNRVDMVADKAGQVLYITSGSEVLRYDLVHQRFLNSFAIGGHLMGIDLSADGQTLAVADKTYSNGQVWIYLVNAKTGKSQKVTFSRASYLEGGTYSVAFGEDGDILVTTQFLGSGQIPLRKYSPKTGTTTELTSIWQDTMLAASAKRNVIAFAESNISDGRWGRYDVKDGNLVERTWYTDGTGDFNFEIGTNRTGTQFAIPTYLGTKIYNSTFTKIATVGQSGGPRPIGVVYHPTKNIVYFAWLGTQEVRAFDATTFQPIASYNTGYTFQNTSFHAYQDGRLKISHDGGLLFANVGGGIWYVRLHSGD